MARKPVSITARKDQMVDGYYSFEMILSDDAWTKLGDKSADALENMETYIYQSLKNLGVAECHAKREDKEFVSGALRADGRSKDDAKELIQQAWALTASLATAISPETAEANRAANARYNALHREARNQRREEYRFFKDYRPYDATGRPDLSAPFTHISVRAVQPLQPGGLGFDEESDMQRRGLRIRDLIREDALVVNVEVEHPDAKNLRAICAKAATLKPKNESLATEFGAASRRDPEAFRMSAIMRRSDLNALLVQLGAALELQIPPLDGGQHSGWDDVKLKKPVRSMKKLRLKTGQEQ